MRLHHLGIQAFGPFADRQCVDFDALSSQGLFLLNGPTGAGKSSVLDAVCFALYGSVPGARHTAKRLRSDHAAASVAPEIDLEFSVADRRFRVVRSPAWDRPARRGGGTTTEQARTLLSERIGAEWVQKSARNDEAGLELQHLLGMDKEQFTKVVMLPQGEFAAFLRADAKSRRELLQRLFSTTRFEDLEKLFAEQSQRAAKNLSGQEARQRQFFLRAIDEAERHGLGPADTGVDAGSSDRWGEAMQALSSSLSARHDAAAAESTELAERSALADGALTALRQRRNRAEALEQVRAQQQDHDGRATDVERMVELVRCHDQARGMSTLLRLDAEGTAEGDGALSSLDAALDRLRNNSASPEYLDAGQLDLAEVSRDVLTSACASTSAVLGVLRAALPDEERLQQVRAELGTRTAEIEGLDQRIAEAHGLIMTLQLARTADAEILVPLREAAGTVTQVRATLDAAVALAGTVRRYRSAEKRRTEVDADYAEAAERYLALKEQWLVMLQLRLDQAAEELADKLIAGEPCPVCGSEDHPAPKAAPGGERVTLDEERAARVRQDAAGKTAEQAREVRDQVRVEVAELAAQGGDVLPEAAEEATRSARTALQEAEKAQAEAELIAERLRRAQQDEERTSRVRDALREERATCATRRSSLLDQEAELQQRLAGLQGGAPSLTARISEVQHTHDDIEAVRDRLDALAQCTARQQETRRHLEEALLDSAFATADDARSALMPQDRHERLVGAIRAHELRGHRLDAMWDDDGVRACLREEQDGSAPPSADEVQHAATAAAELRTRAQRVMISAEVLGHSVAQLEAYEVQLAVLEVEIAPLREQSRLAADVAETARGGGENLYKMSLATYVLASRLEQVAAAATERLLQMSDGRYALVHSDATAGNRRSGLGLNVIDGWTGLRRDTSTLSGGESFMASLALALGLADVVQQETGGLDIETLFVDEGFGSLDDQALEQVMDALEGLRSGGRVIGLVSHVAELKQRVSAQLQVVKGRQGSSLRYVEQNASV